MTTRVTGVFDQQIDAMGYDKVRCRWHRNADDHETGPGPNGEVRGLSLTRAAFEPILFL
jgi:hypothetical protein